MRSQNNTGSRTVFTVADTTNGALLHVRGQSPAIFFDQSSGGIGKAFLDSADFAIQSGTPASEGTERVRIESDGRVGINTNSELRGQFNIFEGTDFNIGSTGGLDNIYLSSDATPGNNVKGASIAWSRPGYRDRRAAAIASVQTTSDEDQVGLSFFTHPSTDATANLQEQVRITHDGKVGIGTDDPAEKLSVDGIIESTSHLGDSATEGGQLVLRAPRNQTGSKYRYAIDNYWGEASHGRAGGAGNEVSGIRFIREDDSPAANGQVLMSLAEDGILYLPYQPAFDAVYDTGNGAHSIGTANTEIVFNVTNNNRGNHFNTSTGRFTAPIGGTYFFSIGAMNDNGSGQPAWYELRINGSLLSNPHNPYMSVQNGSGFRYVTGQYVVSLNDGDYASVFTGSHTGGLYGGGNNHNHFVGYLIG